MLLRNKKTGEIWDIGKILLNDYPSYDTLEHINEDFEDYEEPKVYWYIDDAGVIQIDNVLSSEINMRKSIGNYFETRGQVELAVRKLKAIKRLKDKGFEIYSWDYEFNMIDKPAQTIILKATAVDANNDLDLLFGGE